MAGKRKRKNGAERPGIHPRNKYADNTPDFGLLSSLYPSFEPYVFYSRDGRPKIDWTDFNSTRELTRVLLLHDNGLNCQHVQSRAISKYSGWSWYPILHIYCIDDVIIFCQASIDNLRLSLVFSRIMSNFRVKMLIVTNPPSILANLWIPDGQLCPTVPNRSNYIRWIEDLLASDIIPATRADGDVTKGFDIGTGANCIYPLLGASILGWKFVGSDITDIAIEWANRNVNSNPHISDLIEIRRVDAEGTMYNVEELHNEGRFDSNSTNARDDGRASTVPEPHLGVKKSYNGPPILLGVVKDGESFDFCMCNPPFFETMEEAGLNPKTACGGTPEEMVCCGGEHAFITRIIEDSAKLKHTFRAFNVSTVPFMYCSQWNPTTANGGVSCKLDAAAFNVDVTASKDQIDAIVKTETHNKSEAATCHLELNVSSSSSSSQPDALRFRISVFQQNPGTLLVRGTLHERASSIPEAVMNLNSTTIMEDA
ncbi:hypothetical protein DH2020_029619 [Rehmannia glutinosa]|uniref:U6 small nuclear RNA (adenine-(43)-N(6))-methyltransferase n=1 Tax=Rehmannia glutinosa TaxID=99300 RepID=A0ABR0VQM6_REHGL